jgi:hypothetical protein
MRPVTHDQTSDSFDKSQLRRWCIGIVAETKPDYVDIVKVFPVEHLTYEEGDVLETETYDASVPDKNGVVKSSSTQRQRWLEAKWLPDGADGRQSAPDVVNGETVVLYRYANSEKFFWRTMFREPKLRRLEHVVHAFSNLKEGRDAFDMKSSYGYVFSTKNKFIQIWTSDSDGEDFIYDLAINTQENTYHVRDNIDNIMGIISDEKEVYCRNAAGTYTRWVDQDIISNAMREWKSTAVKKHLMISPLTVVDSPVTVFKGNVRVDGHLYASASLATGGLVVRADSETWAVSVPVGPPWTGSDVDA